MRRLACLFLCSSLTAVAQAEAPSVDAKALEPITGASWVEGRCDAPSSVTDWAIDTDGQVYRRDGGLTLLSQATFAAGTFVTEDTVGIGLTRSEYALKDGQLRLMQEVWYEEGDASGTPTVQVKDGQRDTSEGAPEKTYAPTPSLTACPARASLFPDLTIKALDGKWVASGGSCAEDRGTVTFDLKRAAPRVIRTDLGESVGGEAYALEIVREENGYLLTEGSAFEASQYRLRQVGRGLEQSSADMPEAPKVTLNRCS